MFVATRESGPIQTNSYLLADDNKNAVIIDAPLGILDLFVPIIEENNLNLQALLLTHSHWDHMLDAKKIVDRYQIPLFVHQLDAYRLNEPNKHTVFQLPFTIEAVAEQQYVDDGECLKFGDIEIDILHTPGHTEGGVCYVLKNENIIFSGDTLFRESIGRADLPGASLSQLLHSIRTKIINLSPNYKVLSGHGPATTIEHEIHNNPFI
ncbi:MAG TPA: MBL fold metallo-hydrolase [Candidatus Kapabacteria bacterium]|nr:MBL fold metallo-hydrolase [Candidatus Kapabacteria bacterium]